MMKAAITAVRIAVLSLALATPLAMAFPASAQSRAEDRMDRAYESGLRLLDKREYADAIKQFDGVIEGKGARAAGALYWRAWALYRMNRRTEALETLTLLERGYPASSWKNDGKALELEIRQASGQSVSPDSIEDEELKMVALYSLAMSDPDRAMPTVEKILRGPYSMKMKKKALFVLTQFPSKNSSALIERVARGELNPDLQMEAIEFIGVMGIAGNRDILASIYEHTPNRNVREQILESYMVSGDKARLLGVARSEKDETLRAKAAEQLGVMGADDELRQLYERESSSAVKRKIIEAMFVGGNKSMIENIARNEKDRELRKKAIESLGLLGPSTASVIVDIYRNETDPDLRRKAIEALGLLGDSSSKQLLEIYRTEKDPDVKKKVIEALFVQGNAKALIDLARQEKDPRMKKKIVEQLSVMGSEEASQYLLEILGM